MTVPGVTGNLRAEAEISRQDHLMSKAREFEGILLSQLMEKLKEAYRVPGSELDQNPADESMGALATSALGGGLAKSGGVGIARMIVQSLMKSAPSAENVNREF